MLVSVSVSAISKNHLLLVGLVLAVGVADLAVDVFLLADHVVSDTLGVCVLKIGVEVDLDDTIADGVQEVLLAGTGSSVEDEEDGLLVLSLLLLLDVLLVLLEELRSELDVSGLVHTVDVTETGRNREVRRDRRQTLVDVVDVLRLGVETVVVDILVVHTVFLTTSDTDLHLEPLLHGRGTLKVLGGGLNVLLDRLLGQIDHVAGEERSTILLEKCLVGIEHTVEPWQKLLGAVVGVEDDRDAVGGSDSTNVVSSCNRTSDRRLLVLVADTLAGEVSSTTLADLEDDGRFGVTGSLKRRNDGRGGSHVNGGNGENLLLGVFEKLLDIICRERGRRSASSCDGRCHEMARDV
jgi:hypothetical protein